MADSLCLEYFFSAAIKSGSQGWGGDLLILHIPEHLSSSFDFLSKEDAYLGVKLRLASSSSTSSPEPLNVSAQLSHTAALLCTLCSEAPIAFMLPLKVVVSHSVLITKSLSGKGPNEIYMGFPLAKAPSNTIPSHLLKDRSASVSKRNALCSKIKYGTYEIRQDVI